jgi:uncharacterized membrane protein YedE/YeeE
MNSAYRDVIFVNDFTLFRGWLIALGIAMIGANLIEDLGLMGEMGLRRTVFAPVAAIVGGYLFGLGMVIAGGCGSGVLYKQGEGQFAAFVATTGFVTAILATIFGPLAPINAFLRSYRVSIGTDEWGDPITNPALWNIIGNTPTIKWIVIAVLVAIIIPIVLKGKPFAKGPKKGWSWSVGGALIGVVVVFAWWASYYWGGMARSLSFTGPLAEFVMFVFMADSHARFDPMFNVFGIGNISWSALYVLGVPIGAYISAKGLGEFKLTTPREASELVRVFAGGLIMGVGAVFAGG